jgi:hypothetical protein
MSLTLKDLGRSALVSAENVKGIINESAGLGLDLYISKRKLAAITAPDDYLEAKNTALSALAGTSQGLYDAALLTISTQVHNAERSITQPQAADFSWVKNLAAERAAFEVRLAKQIIELQYPLEGSSSAVKVTKKGTKSLRGLRKAQLEAGQ